MTRCWVTVSALLISLRHVMTPWFPWLLYLEVPLAEFYQLRILLVHFTVSFGETFHGPKYVETKLTTKPYTHISIIIAWKCWSYKPSFIYRLKTSLLQWTVHDKVWRRHFIWYETWNKENPATCCMCMRCFVATDNTQIFIMYVSV